jgi:hypothetical protein
MSEKLSPPEMSRTAAALRIVRRMGLKGGRRGSRHGACQILGPVEPEAADGALGTEGDALRADVAALLARTPAMVEDHRITEPPVPQPYHDRLAESGYAKISGVLGGTEDCDVLMVMCHHARPSASPVPFPRNPEKQGFSDSLSIARSRRISPLSRSALQNARQGAAAGDPPDWPSQLRNERLFHPSF